MERFPQKLINVTVAQKPDISTVSRVADAIRAVEKKLGNKGRVLVRYSGTQPMCRVMVEGPTIQETDAFCQEIAQVVRTELS